MFAGTNALPASGNILELKFRTTANAPDSTYISISNVNMYDKNGTRIDCRAIRKTIPIQRIIDSTKITNIKSYTENGKKIVTANISRNDVVCYLANYENGILSELDIKHPTNGSVELSVSDNGKTATFLVWSEEFKPLMFGQDI